MARLLPDRDRRGHKGTFGKLLVVAGSLDYAGAALLVCRAAGRAGAGLVTLAVPESLQPLFAAKVVEATTMALPEDDVEEVDPEPALAKILDHEHDALVIGPGLRPALATADLLRLLLTVPEEPAAARRARRRGAPDARVGRRLVDVRHPALRADPARRRVRPPAGRLGPRPGRGRRPQRRTTRRGSRAASAAATEWRQVVVLKGARTVIAAPDGAVGVAPFENPAMAIGRHRATSCPGRSARSWPRGCARTTPRASASTSTASPATRSASGSATPACWRAICPDALPLVRKRLAALAERLRAGRRLGFGAREAPPAGDAPPANGAAG